MILIDDRVGSADLAPGLEAMGLPVFRNDDGSLPRLDAGDIAFQGRGPGDTPLDIGIELKKLTTTDCIDSLKTGRLNAQGERMLGPTGLYAYAWLVIEGRHRVTRTGDIEVWKGRRRGGLDEWETVRGMSASQLQKRVLTQELCGGFHVRFTNDRRATLHFVADLYRWWTDDAFDDHTSHLADHDKLGQGFLPISDFRKVVQKIPGVGPKYAAAAERQFINPETGKPSLRLATCGSIQAWADLTSKDRQGRLRRLGQAIGERIVAFCKGE